MNRFRPALPAILSFLIAGILFAICLRNDFVYDDVLLLLTDDRIESPGNWGRFFTESYNGGVDNLYRPLASLSYAIQRYLHPGAQWPFFAVNILLHAACAAAVAELARRLLSRDRLAGGSTGLQPEATALMAGLLFAVHPVHSEVVASVVGRCESMAALAMLVAMILFFGPMTGARALAIWACGVVALLSKEQGLLLPLILLIQFFLVRDRTQPKRSGMVLLVLLICWTWAGYILFRETNLKFWWERSLLDWTQQPLIEATTTDRWLAPIAVLGRYIQLMLVPRTLSIDYGYAVTTPIQSINDPMFWLGVGAVIVWITCVFAAWFNRDRTTLFLLSCLALTYAIISNGPTLIGTIMGERLIYLPSAFAIILVSMALGLLRRTGVVLAGVVIVFLAIRTLAYVATFDDRLAFYESQARAQPGSVKIRILLASELVNRHRLEDAAAVAAAARKLAPKVSEVWYQSGYIALEQGDLVSARLFLNEAIRLHRNPTKATALLQQVDAAAATQPAGLR